MTYFQIESDRYENAYAHLLEWLQEAIQRTFEEERASRRLTQLDIAQELKIHPSVVSRRINGGGNVTLRSISDLYTAMGREPLANFMPPEHYRYQKTRLPTAVLNPNIIVYVPNPSQIMHDDFPGWLKGGVNSWGVTTCVLNMSSSNGPPINRPRWDFNQSQTIDLTVEETIGGS